MVNTLFSRALVAMGIFIAGLHFVGFGMMGKGSADPRNPIWRGISTLFTIEVAVLKFLGFAALVVGLITVLITVVSHVTESCASAKAKPSSEENPHVNISYSMPSASFAR